MSTPRNLLLFDIDGTLITSGGAGENALRQSLQQRFGVDDDLSHIQIPGATDSGIAGKILGHHGIPSTPENIAAFLDGYLENLPTELAGRNGQTLPGVFHLLETLRLRPCNALALLTGNLERGAKIKLTHFGLWHYFEWGAYADDHHDRNQLGHFARNRAMERLGIDFAPESIFIIGDTPRDIACGRAIGARTVAVATGGFSREELAAHQPDHVFDDFSDVDGVIATLGW